MRPTAAHLDAEANRIAAVAMNLIATASSAGQPGAGDDWIAQPGVRRQIVVDLDHIITHAQALRQVFADAPEPQPAAPAPETNTEPRSALPAIDTRIVDAMLEIGSIVEHDEGLAYGRIGRTLITLGEITKRIGSAREQRRAGSIAIAQRFEREVEQMISGLPKEVLWS